MPQPKPSPAVTVQNQETKIPAWADAQGQANVARANEIAAMPFMSYDQPRVAGVDPLEAAAPGMVAGGLGAANAGFMTAQNAATGATGFDPRMVGAPGGVGDVSATGFLGRDIGKYMDPNIESVVNTTLSGFDQNAARQVQSVNDAARGVGAWGGSRHGVESAVLKAQQGEARARTEAGLRSGAFTDAAGRIMTDNTTALQAALANQAAGLTTQGQRLTAEQANQAAAAEAERVRLAGGSLAASTGSAAGTAANQAGMLTAGFGQTQRGVAQQGLDTNFQEFMRQIGYPQEGLNTQLSALGMTPMSKSTSGTTVATPSTTPVNPWMAGIGAAGMLLPMMMPSDRQAKKEIKLLDKVPGTDLNTYQFKYKKGFMGADLPPQVGLMADDVRKKVGPLPIMKQVTPTGKKIDAVNVPLAVAHARKKRVDAGMMRGTYKPRIGGIRMGV
jgi:hypothetical protein